MILSKTEKILIEWVRRLPPGDVERLIETAAAWVSAISAAEQHNKRK
jgi:hypothetical protein